jgi:hypothetical protein
MTRREYRGNAQATTITADLNPGVYTIYASSLVGNDDWPDGSIGPFFVVVNRGKNNEEKILCESRTDGTILVVNPGGRGADETPESSHTINSSIEHVFTATDADEANLHVNSSVNVHDIADTADLLVMDDPRLGTAAYKDVPAGSPPGDASNTQVVMGNDSRLFDDRTPEDNSVTTIKIVDLNVTTAKIASNAITAGKIATNAVDTPQIASGAVETTQIADSAVTTAKIDSNSVTTAKIVNENVTTTKIANLAVTTGKIADDAVTTAKIADDAIATVLIADGAVTSAKIANLTIVNGDINASAAIEQSKISGLVGDLNNRVLSANGIDNRILASGDGAGTIANTNTTESVTISYASAGFTVPPDVVACMAENTLRTIGVVSRTASQATFQIRNTAGAVGANTPFTFFWIATGI